MPVRVARTRVLQAAGAAGQSPVALVAADGESLSGNVQSNFAGNGFWTRNGLTYARDWSGANPLGGTFQGFDDPTFVPIACWLMDFVGTSMYTRLDDLGVNGFLPAWSSIDPDDAIANDKWMAGTDAHYAAGSISSTHDPAILGVSTGEEPHDDTTFNAIKNAAATWLANGSDGPGRFHLFNFAHHLLDQTDGFQGGNTTTLAQMVNASDPSPPSSRRQWTTCDMYWYAGSNGGTNNAPAVLPFRMYQHLTSDATADEALRGCHYGSMLDAIRVHYDSQPSGPIGVWVENGAPFDESFTHEITPAELGWAVWSTFVHGARSIHYFNHTFRADDPQQGVNNFGNNYYGGPGVAGTGIYAKAKEVNRRALQIAPAINAPRDGYFAYGAVTFGDPGSAGNIDTPGFLTAVTSTNARGPFAGVEACCKWVPTESKHYILSTTRESGSATNVPATYRMVDQGQTAAVDPFTLTSTSISRGGAIPAGYCEFSTTFSSARDYKTFRID